MKFIKVPSSGALLQLSDLFLIGLDDGVGTREFLESASACLVEPAFLDFLDHLLTTQIHFNQIALERIDAVDLVFLHSFKSYQRV
ncbi:hypothetical protein G3495_13750 [Shewanella baltica]|uniref:hypothetical protein n=1 Tax=Shewanella baltica TaxID=62322 RepID=UPI00217D320A|nr:hypothetical protein [Shewanella baltica]MCS6236180.1 hypothetical protein [Shewanella baltica]MCS6270707.1 hypothetical protein [Shewanella baltica]